MSIQIPPSYNFLVRVCSQTEKIDTETRKKIEAEIQNLIKTNLLDHPYYGSDYSHLGSSTLLIRAVKWQNFSIATLLLKARANPNCINSHGNAALDFANYYNVSEEIKKQLHFHGAKTRFELLKELLFFYPNVDYLLDNLKSHKGDEPIDFFKTIQDLLNFLDQEELNKRTSYSSCFAPMRCVKEHNNLPFFISLLDLAVATNNEKVVDLFKSHYHKLTAETFQEAFKTACSNINFQFIKSCLETEAIKSKIFINDKDILKDGLKNVIKIALLPKNEKIIESIIKYLIEKGAAIDNIVEENAYLYGNYIFLDYLYSLNKLDWEKLKKAFNEAYDNDEMGFIKWFIKTQQKQAAYQAFLTEELNSLLRYNYAWRLNLEKLDLLIEAGAILEIKNLKSAFLSACINCDEENRKLFIKWCIKWFNKKDVPNLKEILKQGIIQAINHHINYEWFKSIKNVKDLIALLFLNGCELDADLIDEIYKKYHNSKIPYQIQNENSKDFESYIMRIAKNYKLILIKKKIPYPDLQNIVFSYYDEKSIGAML